MSHISEPLDDQDQLIAFSRWIEDNSKPGHNQSEGLARSPKFMPRTTLTEYLRQGSRTKALLTASNVRDVDAQQVQENCSAIYAILIRIRKPDYISHFTKHPTLWDERLPFLEEPKSFPYAGTDGSCFDQFYEEQWRFCAHKFDGSTDVHLENRYILPFLEMRKLAESGMTEVFEVKLHPNYDNLDPLSDVCDDSKSVRKHRNTYTLKRFRSKHYNAEKLYKAEVDGFKHLKESDAQCDHIVKFYGSFVQSGQYSILLEYADIGTLEDYFHNQPPPETGEEKFRFWKSMFGLIKAIYNIHNIENSDNISHQRAPIFKGWHQDIKPKNILVFSGSSTSPCDFIFKLADLGLSHFRRVSEGEDRGEFPEISDRDTGGTRIYGAPECYRFASFMHDLKRSVGQSADVWSLGCVYSEAALWVDRGPRQLLSYRHARKLATETIPGHSDPGCFHDKVKALNCVWDTHRSILDDLRPTDHITRPVLDDLVEKMLCKEPEARLNAQQLFFAAERVCERTEARITAKGHDRVDSGSSEIGRLQGKIESPRDNETSPLQDFMHRPQRRSTDTETILLLAETNPSNINACSRQAMIESKQTSALDGVHHLQSIRTLPAPGWPRSALDAETDIFQGSQASKTATIYAAESSSKVAPVEETASGSLPMAHHSKRLPVITLEEVEQKMSRKDRLSFFGSSSKADKKLAAMLDEDGNVSNLGKRDHVFLVDDAESMKKHWSMVQRVLKALAWFLQHYDKDGMELYFMRNTTKFKSRDPDILASHLERIKCANFGASDVNVRLAEILKTYRDRLDAHHSQKLQLEPLKQMFRSKSAKKKPSGPKPLNVYILTDGRWHESCDARESIKPMVDKLVQYSYQTAQVGLQFIQFGDDLEVYQKLQRLDDRVKLDVERDLVDHECVDGGNVLKMVVGAVNKEFDEGSTHENPPLSTTRV